MEYVNKVFRAVLVIFLVVVILGVALTKILSSTILNEAYIFNKLKSSNYYTSLLEEIQGNFEKYIGQSGMDAKVLTDICTIQDVQKDTEIILGNIYEGTNKQINSEVIKERLAKNIKESQKGQENSVATQKAIDEFISKLGEEYVSTVSHTAYEGEINQKYKQINKLIDISQKALEFAMVVIIALLALLNMKNIYRIVTNIGVAITATGTFLVISNIVINASIKIQQIRILNDSISVVIQNITQNILYSIMKTGSILLALGIILIIISNIIMDNERTKE